MKYILFIVVLVLLCACDEKSVESYARSHEWDHYEITGYRFFACSKEDFYQTGFIATKNGKSFTGTVCKGLLWRGSTLRLDG